MSYDRGNLKTKMAEAPLKYGEYFFDIGSSSSKENLTSDVALFIGTGTGNDWEWTPNGHRDGGYIKIGGAGGLNIIGHITEMPTTHESGVIYILDNDLAVTNGTIANSNTTLKEGDLIVDTGDEFIRVNNSYNAANIPGLVIDDTTSSATKTYSSNKIDSKITELTSKLNNALNGVTLQIV